MAYSKALDQRIIEIVSTWDDVIPREMFGGVCYLLNGNIVCGIVKEYLMVIGCIRIEGDLVIEEK